MVKRIKKSTVARVSLAHIYETLRQEIITGAIPAGSRLTEERLAADYGVSRTPIREALRLLQREGLVQVIPGRGATVPSISQQDIIDIYQCRAYLRGLVSRLAAERKDPQTLARLQSLLRVMEDAVARNDLNAYFVGMVNFDEAICEAAGNRVLTQLLDSLGSRVLRMRFMAIAIPGRARRSLEGHQKLLAALQAGDGQQAETIASGLIVESMHALLQTYYVPMPLPSPASATVPSIEKGTISSSQSARK